MTIIINHFLDNDFKEKILIIEYFNIKLNKINKTLKYNCNT